MVKKETRYLPTQILRQMNIFCILEYNNDKYKPLKISTDTLKDIVCEYIGYELILFNKIFE